MATFEETLASLDQRLPKAPLGASVTPDASLAPMERLTAALRNAHNAGDTAAATRIAQIIRERQASEGAREQQALAAIIEAERARREGLAQSPQPTGTRTFLITAPDGRTFNVQGENQDGALAALRTMLAQDEAGAGPIIVQGTDGQRFEFPAGTPDSVMVEALQRHYGPPSASQSPGFLATLADNVIGLDNGVTSPGETLGAYLNDAGSALGAGVARGVTGLLGLPGTVDDLISTGLERTGIMQPLPEDAPQWADGNPLSGQTLGGLLSYVTDGASDYRGETTLGEFAGTIGEFLPGAALPGATMGNLFRYGMIPGAASEAAGQATEGTEYESTARIAAALLAPMAWQGAENAARRAISPYGGADPQRLTLAQVLDDADIPVTAGQRVGAQQLQRREALTMGGQQMLDDQAEAFTRAALRTVGTDATRATPDVMRDTLQRIGQTFDDVTRGVDVTPDQALVDRLNGAVRTYAELTSTAQRAPAVGNIAREVSQAVTRADPISATRLTAWRRTLSSLTRSADQATREAAIEALEALDDALAGTLRGIGRADDVMRLELARNQYRNFLVLERAVSGAGQDAAVGLISPATLRNALAAQGRRAYVTGGRGDLGDLARAGAGVMTRPATSGTPEGLMAMGLTTGIPAGFGGAIGSMIGGSGGAVMGGLLGAMAPQAIRNLQVTSPMQRYIANQLVGPGRGLLDPRALATGGGLLAPN